MTSHHHSLVTGKSRTWHLSRSPLIPFNGQWKGQFSDRLTRARRNNLHQCSVTENQCRSNTRIWSCNYVSAPISTARHTMAQYQGTIHLSTWQRLKYLLLCARGGRVQRAGCKGTEDKKATPKARHITAEDQNQHSHKSFPRALVCSVPLTQSN